jgi:hypothetical protein
MCHVFPDAWGLFGGLWVEMDELSYKVVDTSHNLLL